jgi:hypothetical protein
VCSTLGEMPARLAMQVLEIEARQRVVVERCAPRLNEAAERFRALVDDEATTRAD